jgi:benzoyl-CoA-dihydrodiol lyase
MDPIRFQTHPSRYRHWRLTIDGGPVARLAMDVQEHAGLNAETPLKLNSYDLGVDIELADAVQRLRFSNPEVRAVILTSAKDRVFCAGANIFMLGASSHAFKVNFCKFTNETRLAIEDSSAESGLRWLAAVNGACAGGGYELALACDEILLVDDGSSAVSLPEVPLLGVLPGTGGLTRVVDKRKVRRDLADVFSTLGEGVKGKRAMEWGLVDRLAPSSRFAAAVEERARALAEGAPRRGVGTGAGRGIVLPDLEARYSPAGAEYRYVSLKIDAARRTGSLTVRGPEAAAPRDSDALRSEGAATWALRAFRELDDALLELRFNHLTTAVVALRTEGDGQAVLAHDEAMERLAAGGDWLAAEVLALQKRVLKRLDLTARTFFALIEPGSCFAGSLLELAFAADRSYMKNDPEAAPHVAVGAASAGRLPMSNGLTRLQTRFLGAPQRAVAAAAARGQALDPDAALAAGLVTFAPDDIDWDDEVRVAVEERASLSPDALTGMEANLRFAGPETMETKIFGRLSAWQNWIFTRPNATGEKGALTMYGKPERAVFDFRRT